MKVKLKKLNENARVPEFATPGSFCFDIYGVEARRIADNVIEYSTGFAVEIPKGYGMFIYSRSGQGFKYQTRLSNCVGVIDSDYRGEVKVQLISDIILLDDDEENPKYDPFDFSKAIAQAEIRKKTDVTFEVTEELSSTSRGKGGFGSTDEKGSTVE